MGRHPPDDRRNSPPPSTPQPIPLTPLPDQPNFLHAGDHVHLGPGVTATRQTNPAIDLHSLPRIDLVLLSHYHASVLPLQPPHRLSLSTKSNSDHFDQAVEASLRRDLPIITTPHAHAHLSGKPGAGEAFTQVHALDTFDSMLVDVEAPPPSVDERGKVVDAPQSKEEKGRPALKVTAMPGEHVPRGPLSVANELLGAVSSQNEQSRAAHEQPGEKKRNNI